MQSDACRPARTSRSRSDTAALRASSVECALCHSAQSVQPAATLMEQWWGKHYSRPALRSTASISAPPCCWTTLARGKPHEQFAAITALGERPIPATVEVLAAQLSHPYPLVRFQAKRALERATGRAVELDLHLAPAQLAPQVRAWLDGGS